MSRTVLIVAFEKSQRNMKGVSLTLILELYFSYIKDLMSCHKAHSERLLHKANMPLTAPYTDMICSFCARREIIYSSSSSSSSSSMPSAAFTVNVGAWSTPR